MRLAEILTLRHTVGAGLFVTLTERCPLHCAHCSTRSGRFGRTLDAELLGRFVASFTADTRPEVMMFTGGEPMLHARTVVELAAAARPIGVRTAVLTGAYFARRGLRPAALEAVAAAVDHLSVSIDAFHEREVPRAEVFALLRWLLDRGVHTSVHAVGEGPDDPYLADLTTAVTGTFGPEVPMLVTAIAPVGRARDRALAAAAPPHGTAVLPCPLAAWPVVTVDGTVTACCHQDAVDETVAAAAAGGHLRLGDITDGWPELLARTRRSPVLRMVRTVGPVYAAARTGAPPAADYCATCHRFTSDPRTAGWAESAGRGAAGELLEQTAVAARTAAGPADLVRRLGVARYADLVAPGGAPC